MPMVEKKLGRFMNQNNDTEILLNEIMNKNFVYIRDKPAIDHLVMCYIFLNYLNKKFKF